jgi:phosphohistidine phosphatase
VEPPRLVLVRHAKAADGPVDVERPLTGRGRRNAAAIGGWLAEHGLLPDRVLVSPAVRTRQTWEHASRALAPPPESVVEPGLYDNTVEDVLAVVRPTPAEVTTLAVVGHNPSVAELAATLDDGRGDPAAAQEMAAGFRTGAVAVFRLAVPFAEVAAGTGTLDRFVVPRD